MMLLPSFSSPLHAVVVGHSGGIGQAIAGTLLADSDVGLVTGGARRVQASDEPKLRSAVVDIAEENSIARFAKLVEANDPPRLVVVSTGLLHDGDALQPERSMRALNAGQLERYFQVNVIGPALLAKHLLPLLPRSGKSVFAVLSARVGSISDNRLGGWHGYRASKAALNMMVRNLHIEQNRRAPQSICVALHPGTVDTMLSKPFQRGLPDGQLLTPQASAEALLRVIDGLSPADGGKQWAWDGQEIMP